MTHFTPDDIPEPFLALSQADIDALGDYVDLDALANLTPRLRETLGQLLVESAEKAIGLDKVEALIEREQYADARVLLYAIAAQYEAEKFESIERTQFILAVETAHGDAPLEILPRGEVQDEWVCHELKIGIHGDLDAVTNLAEFMGARVVLSRPDIRRVMLGVGRGGLWGWWAEGTGGGPAIDGPYPTEADGWRGTRLGDEAADDAVEAIDDDLTPASDKLDGDVTPALNSFGDEPTGGNL